MKILTDINGKERTGAQRRIVAPHVRRQTLARHARNWEIHRQGMALLDTLRVGKSFYTFQGSTGWTAMAEEMKKTRAAVNKEDQGLTTEINTSTSLVSLRDTLDNISDLLRRHPHGYRDGDGEGADVLNPENVVVDEPVAKPNFYQNRRPVMKKGKLVWMEETKAA